MEVYRIVIRKSGKWRIGRITYTDLHEANERRQYFIQQGIQPQDIKILTDSELFN